MPQNGNAVHFLGGRRISFGRGYRPAAVLGPIRANIGLKFGHSPTQPRRRQLETLGWLAVEHTKAKRTVDSKPVQPAQTVQNGLLDTLLQSHHQ